MALLFTIILALVYSPSSISVHPFTILSGHVRGGRKGFQPQYQCAWLLTASGRPRDMRPQGMSAAIQGAGQQTNKNSLILLIFYFSIQASLEMIHFQHKRPQRIPLRASPNRNYFYQQMRILKLLFLQGSL